MEIDSQAEATAVGWTEIDYDRDLPMANFTSICADFRERLR